MASTTTQQAAVMQAATELLQRAQRLKDQIDAQAKTTVDVAPSNSLMVGPHALRVGDQFLTHD